MKTGHGSVANRAVRTFAVSAAGESFEQRATSLYKFSARLLPSSLLLKLCIAPYEIGIFFLKLFEVFLEQLKLSVEKGDVLLQDDGRTVFVNESLNFTEDRNSHSEYP